MGAGDDIIATENGLLQSECAELAAATVGGLYWTWKKKSDNVRGLCWVRKTNYHRTSKPEATTADVVSGNRACGVPRKH